jgi:hypothetical protein
VKAQEDSATPALQSKLRRLSSYLIEYSDYIVLKRGRLRIIEVKAPVVLRSLKRPFGSQPVNFSLREMEEYSASPVPVKVLLWEYGLARSLLELQSRVFYALADFRDFETLERLAETVKLRLHAPQKVSPRWVSAKTVRSLLQRSNAMRVKDIKPGCVIRD